MTQIAAILLGLTILSWPAEAGKLSLSGANGCDIASIVIDTVGNAAVVCKTSGSIPPDTPPPPVEPPPTGCNLSSVRHLSWGVVDQLKMASGQVTAYPLISPNAPKSSIILTQGQMASTPAGVVTEMSVSRCPGVIDPSVQGCYRQSSLANNNNIVAYTKQVFGWNSQATLGNRGCWAPASQGLWYVNVRWTFPSCPFGSGCGFSMQWANGPY